MLKVEICLTEKTSEIKTKLFKFSDFWTLK